MAQVKVTIKNVNLGGIADSNYLGAANSVAEMVGFDIHSEPGIMKVNQALTKESGSTIDDFVKCSVACSDGKTYLFGSTNRKIWSRDSAGTYTLEATAAPAIIGSTGIKDAIEYEGYIYYTTYWFVGRVAVGAAWSTRDDNWAQLGGGASTGSDANWHPMKIVNGVLFIGVKGGVDQIDASTGSAVYSAYALKIPSNLIVKCLGQLGTDLLIGTYVNSNVVETEVFRWNTWSISFTNSDPIPEVGINSFLAMDNFVLVNCGTKGNLYSYDGVKLEPYKQIKGTWDNSTNKGIVHPNARLNFHGLPLFGLSTSSGSPANMGVYSLARANKNYPYVLNCEQGISTGNLNNVEIGCIVGVGDIYLVSWKDTNSGTVYGVDKLDLSNKYAAAYFITRVMMLDRTALLTYGVVNIGYRTLPENTTFTISAKKNNGSMTAISAGDCTDDTMRNVFMSEVDAGEATSAQIKIAPSVSGNNAPEIEAVEIIVQ